LDPESSGKVNSPEKEGCALKAPLKARSLFRVLLLSVRLGKSCENVRANTVIVAGGVNGGITADKLEIRKTGRVWGDVIISAFSTEEGGFLRGQITMQDKVDLGLKQDDHDISESAEQRKNSQQTHLPPKLAFLIVFVN
jgi:hypothetical protein